MSIPNKKRQSPAVLNNVIPFPSERPVLKGPMEYMDEDGLFDLVAWLSQDQSVKFDWIAHDQEMLVYNEDQSLVWRIRRAA